MRTKFWRFAYKTKDLTSILAASALPFPDFSEWPSAKNRSREKVIAGLRVGHFVFLANFDRTLELGIAKAIGKVIANDGAKVSMEWRRLVVSLSLPPDIRGGVSVWNNEGVFCFDVQPARRYKLDAHSTKLFQAIST